LSERAPSESKQVPVRTRLSAVGRAEECHVLPVVAVPFSPCAETGPNKDNGAA
jgi:hypothetical protein